MRVFLAGATGVIGIPLVPQLLNAGHEVTAMTRSVLRASQLDAVGADPVVCDVFDADGVRAVAALLRQERDRGGHAAADGVAGDRHPPRVEPVRGALAIHRAVA